MAIDKVYLPRESVEKIQLIRRYPNEKIIFLGELTLSASKGYKKSYLLNILKKRAFEKGADLLWIIERKNISSDWLVNPSETNNQNRIQSNGVRLKAKIFRYLE